MLRQIVDHRKKLRDEDPELLKQLEPPSFSDWLREHNLLPPDFDQKGYDEDSIREEYEEAMENPLDGISDHEDDTSQFEICIIDKNNSGLIVECFLKEGEIHFGRILSIYKNALEICNLGMWKRRSLKVSLNNMSVVDFQQSELSRGPLWNFLSENLQENFVKYLVSLGIKPEIGLVVEYLSWNKEQRNYMGWMRDFYSLMFNQNKKMQFKIKNESDEYRYIN